METCTAQTGGNSGMGKGGVCSGKGFLGFEGLVPHCNIRKWRNTCSYRILPHSVSDYSNSPRGKHVHVCMLSQLRGQRTVPDLEEKKQRLCRMHVHTCVTECSRK